MDFVVVTALFVVFFLGLVLVGQGFLRTEPTFKHQHVPLTGEIRTTVVEHPPERHPARLIIIGAALMLGAVLAGMLAL
jgi:hypothetical protein